jgi:1,4-alpha-glucan branching enzyme
MSKTKKNVGAIVHKSGVSFRVWAPFANAVAVSGHFNNWGEYPMESEGDGYWHADVRAARAGMEYEFILKNGDKVLHKNDPRGQHFITSSGNCVIVDRHFDWGDDSFKPIPVEQQIIYELHIGTFARPDASVCGTFYDAIGKLDHLESLGVNMIELLPINTMMFDRGWGYATDYIYAVESLYGGRHAFLQFVKEAHERGMGVILDVVYNHFAPDANLDLWQFDGWNKDGKGGIYFYNDWRGDTPWGARPDFGRPEVMQYLTDNVKMWMHECRVDGLRVDSTIYIRNAKGYNDDPSNDLPEGWKLLQNINNVAKKINPNSLIIGEDVASNEYITKPIAEGGAGFDSQWELQFPHVVHEALSSDDPAKINLAGITGMLGRRFNDNALQRVIYTDSHDSAANGSARTNEVIAPGKADGLFARKQSMIAVALLLTTPGIPMLLQGQEFMQWGAFNDWQELNWELAERHKGIVAAHQHLIGLRKNDYGVSAGLLGKNVNILQLDEDNKVLAYHRWKNGGPKDDVVVVINFGNRHHSEYCMSLPRNGTWGVCFNSTWKGYSPDFKDVVVPEVKVENGGGTLIVPPSSVIILSQDA